MIVFVHCFFLGGVAYGEADLLVLSWWCQCCCFKFSISLAGLFFFVFIFSFFGCVHPLCHLGMMLLQRLGVLVSS
jgi:hypothetical protein